MKAKVPRRMFFGQKVISPAQCVINTFGVSSNPPGAFDPPLSNYGMEGQNKILNSLNFGRGCGSYESQRCVNCDVPNYYSVSPMEIRNVDKLYGGVTERKILDEVNDFERGQFKRKKRKRSLRKRSRRRKKKSVSRRKRKKNNKVRGKRRRSVKKK